MTTVLEEHKVQENTDGKTEAACLLTGVKEAAEHMGETLSASKAKIVETLKDRQRSAERFLRQGRFAVEDGVEEGTHRIKRSPFTYVGVAFAAGTIAGILFGRLMAHGGKKYADS